MPVTETQPEIILLARQPIFDTAEKVQGWELLFRDADGGGFVPGIDESEATARVIVSAFADLSLGTVTEGARAWINVPRDLLMSADIPALLPRERVVLELLERDAVDADFVARVTELAEAGYELALDDFSWSDELEPLVRVATHVKLDVRALGIGELAAHVRRLSEYDVRLLAEKVETREEFATCVQLGIGLHQGYFFARPRLVKGQRAAHRALTALKTGARAIGDVSFEEIELIVQTDAALSLRLLRYLNSAAVSLRHRVSTLRQALALVGARTVQQWLLLVIMGDAGGSRPEVLRTGLVRARLCESLAPQARVPAASAFTAGLLSVSDALTDKPIDEVIGALPLAPELAEAIVDRTGPLGRTLEDAIAIERGDTTVRGAGGLMHAVTWADAQITALTAA